jgi:putative intracellular protease/amidase
MDDEETLSFIRQQSINAKYIFSVCTGALILGAAGLLRRLSPFDVVFWRSSCDAGP